MKGSSVYTVEFKRGFKSTQEYTAIERAKTIALETELPIRVYLNGVPRIAVVPPTYKKTVILLAGERAIKIDFKGKQIRHFFQETETDDMEHSNTVNVTAKYYDLKKYNNANFKRLSFR